MAQQNAAITKRKAAIAAPFFYSANLMFTYLHFNVM